MLFADDDSPAFRRRQDDDADAINGAADFDAIC